jgi:fructokinase
VIVVGGEALVDLVDEGAVLRPSPGGGPFNTAIALARLGVPVGFLGCLSTDRYGRRLERELDDAGVDLRYLLRVPAPTPLAVVHTKPDGEPEYTFYLCDTAYAAVSAGELPTLDPEVTALHLGTLALAVDPPSSAYEALLEREAGRRVIVLDPNVRPRIFGDLALYRVRFERWARQAHVVKLSAADAAWLFPGLAVTEVAATLLNLGARLVAVTLGAAGGFAATLRDSVRVPGLTVDVVDTVGAGDTFGAALLARLRSHGCLAVGALAAIGPDALEDALRYAVAAAALTCTRVGAVPPVAVEVESLLAVESAR